jgi:hypothetical protein
MPFFLSLMTLLAAASLPVRVTPVSSEAYEAELTGATAQGFVVEVDGATQTLAPETLQLIERRGPARSGSPGLTVQLRDGSRLKADGVTVADGQVTLELRRQPAPEIAVERLQWIRFQPPSEAVDPQWLGMLDREAAQDTLVIRREGDKLDRVGGVITGIGAEAVAFELDGQAIEAPLARLEGVIFGGTKNDTSAPPIRLTDRYGSVWHLASLGSSDQGESLAVVSVGGVEFELPLDLISRIELASGVQFLAASEPAASGYQPYIAAPEGIERLGKWLGPQAVADRDLLLRSRSSVDYRVAPGFQKFLTTMAIDPSVQRGGGCDVRLLIDGEVAWSESLSINGDPLGVELPLQGASRLRIEVDYGGDGDVGDLVRFRQPRLIK